MPNPRLIPLSLSLSSPKISFFSPLFEPTVSVENPSHPFSIENLPGALSNPCHLRRKSNILLLPLLNTPSVVPIPSPLAGALRTH
ncbi:hypothetical protein I3843_10G159100 [Carya illinoinensis]|nr:hypothetical protein I3843_10G159100 [Carya illinoinensis]KAG7961064.1 hypothetical protein I3843_10G159100 [Carya illinoinensis]